MIIRIVFGVYSIPVKKINPVELGYTHEDISQFKFAIKQRIFHIFWIPVFPIMRIYTVTDLNGNTYHVTAEVENTMKTMGKFRTPWYSFSLPILGLILLIYFWISDAIMTSKYQAEAEIAQIAFTDYSRYQLNHLQKGDILIMESSALWDYNLNSGYGKKYILALDSIVQNVYYAKSIFFDPDQEDTPETNEEILNFFLSKDSLTENVQLSKPQIDAFLGRKNQNDPYTLKGGRYIKGTKFVLHRKLSIYNPNIFFETTDYGSRNVSFNLDYIGPIARIKSFRALKGIKGEAVYNTILANEANRFFKSNFTINGVNGLEPLTFQLTLETEEGKLYRFLFKKTGSEVYTYLL